MTDAISFIATHSIFDIPLVPTIFTLIFISVIMYYVIYRLETDEKIQKDNYLYRQNFIDTTNNGVQPYKSNKLFAIRCLTAFVLILLTIVILLIINYQVALDHGFTGNDITIKRMNQNILKTPSESVLPDDLNQSIIIFYKFNCPDCHAVYDDLKKITDANPDKNIYWISAQTTDGKQLLNKYPVEEVPTGIYISNTLPEGVAYIKHVLYTKDENGNQQLDVDAINRLLQLQLEKR